MSESVNFDLEVKEEPSAWIRIPFRDAEESQTFSRILSEFAQVHDIPESQLRVVSYSLTPQFKRVPVYQSGTVIISSFCVLTPDDSYGQSRMSLLRRDFPPADFKRLADDYLVRFQQAFSNRVQSTFEDSRE